MQILLLDLFSDFAKGASFGFTEPTTSASLLFNPFVLGIGVALILATIFIIFFLKKVVTNSIIGGVIWFVSVFIFKVELPLLPSFVISVLFGPAGIGAMLLLKFFGMLT
jgi:hypothetical protein